MARAARRERSTAEQRLSIGQFAKNFVTWQGGQMLFAVLQRRFVVLQPGGAAPCRLPHSAGPCDAPFARYGRRKVHPVL